MRAEDYFEGSYLTMAKAISGNNTDQMRQTATGLDLNKFGKEDMSLLMWGIIEDRQSAVVELIRLGANPNLRDSQGRQPVYYAAAVEDKSKYLRLLLENGADPNGGSAQTPALHKAADRGYWQNVILLLEHKANVNLPDKDGYTIAATFASLNQFDRVAYLLKLGADPTAKTTAGGTVALRVQENVVDSPDFVAQQTKVKQMLMAQGVKFPVMRPYEKKYETLRQRWYQTSEGQVWQERLEAIGADPKGFGAKWKEAKRAETTAFKQWMAKNNIAEPE